MKRILSYIVAAALFCLATGFPAVAEDLIVEDSVDSRFELVFEIEIVDSLSPELEWLLAEEALAVNGVEAPMGSEAIGPLEVPEPTERPEAVELPEAGVTEAPEVEATEMPEAEATETPEAEATEAPGVEPTETPEVEPTETPEVELTEAPEAEATEIPKLELTETPEVEATEAPGVEPTEIPKVEPTETPEVELTEAPEAEATEIPKVEPTEIPKVEPTETPEVEATETPEVELTEAPEVESTETSEVELTEVPEAEATETPEVEPTEAPRVEPTETPEAEATETPEVEPTEVPEVELTEMSEAEATEAPEVEPSELIIPAVGESEAQGDATPAVPEDCPPLDMGAETGTALEDPAEPTAEAPAEDPAGPTAQPFVEVPAEDSAEDPTPILAEASIETPSSKAPTDELALAPVEAPIRSTSPGTEDEPGDEPVEELETTATESDLRYEVSLNELRWNITQTVSETDELCWNPELCDYESVGKRIERAYTADETSKTITVTNTGAVPLAYAIGYDGRETSPSLFECDGGTGTLQPGQSCALTVTLNLDALSAALEGQGTASNAGLSDGMGKLTIAIAAAL